MRSRTLISALLFLSLPGATLAQATDKKPASAVVDYVVGAQDVLTITSYDQADLSGKFSVEADGPSRFP